MATATLVLVDTYLRSVHQPDCDYVDGDVLERNTGELPHARLQGYFRDLFHSHEADWGSEALPELRLQISANRFRVPDVMVPSLGNLDTLIIRSVLLCASRFSRAKTA